MQLVDSQLAEKAGVAIPANDWDRHHYEAMLPGFGGSDSMDWRAFVDRLIEKGFDGPFEIENEALNSKDTGNLAATVQGFKASVTFLAPMLWTIQGDLGYTYLHRAPLTPPGLRDIPVTTIDQLIG